MSDKIKVVYHLYKGIYHKIRAITTPRLKQIGGGVNNQYLIKSACVAEGVHFFAVEADFKMEVRTC